MIIEKWTMKNEQGSMINENWKMKNEQGSIYIYIYIYIYRGEIHWKKVESEKGKKDSTPLISLTWKKIYGHDWAKNS